MKKKEQKLKNIAYNIYGYMKVSSNELFVSTVDFLHFFFLVEYRRKLRGRISTVPDLIPFQDMCLKTGVGQAQNFWFINSAVV